ncbi:arsenate reductase family protein [Bartonella tamiae]|uniref:Arsenate reductase n=1 Tax=Bartonella tamiae Th239 TaxID=1094558 RepID=J1K3J5_9HYPH|nr:arsenate reductase family protein [Bartonella tamiae]EJF91705.1 arsenate reductase (glutaredoxin) [Bartonella tamiae Th239]EJF92628.1 arsenate reductase (glutaredoxin) [Bartonella tamiae Th307]
MSQFDVIIYHNRQCSTSCNVVRLVSALGYEPHIIEYLKTPPRIEMLLQLAQRADMSIRDFLRVKEKKYHEFSLDDQSLSDDYIAQKMHENPELINRPIVVCPHGVALCRPAESVSELLIGSE